MEEASLGLGRSNKGLKFFELAGPLKPYGQQLLKILGNRIKCTILQVKKKGEGFCPKIIIQAYQALVLPLSNTFLNAEKTPSC